MCIRCNTASALGFRPSICPWEAQELSAFVVLISAMSSARNERDSSNTICQGSIPDASAFANGYCARKELVASNDVNCTAAEKDCHKLAAKAQAEYLRLYEESRAQSTNIDDAPLDSMRAECIKRLSKSNAGESDDLAIRRRKYQRRLSSNRKSAAGRRVYNEVFNRALATALQRSDATVEVTKLKQKIAKIEAEIRVLKLKGDRTQREIEVQQARGKEMAAVIQTDTVSNEDPNNQKQSCRQCNAQDPYWGEPSQLLQNIVGFDGSCQELEASPLLSENTKTGNDLPTTEDIAKIENNCHLSAEEPRRLDMTDELSNGQENQLIFSENTPLLDLCNDFPQQLWNDELPMLEGFMPFHHDEDNSGNNDENHIKAGLSCTNAHITDELGNVKEPSIVDFDGPLPQDWKSTLPSSRETMTLDPESCD